MSTSPKLLLVILLSLLSSPLPTQPVTAGQTPYFQLTIIVQHGDYEAYLTAQRVASRLQRLGIDVILDQTALFPILMYPEHNNPHAIPPPRKDYQGYDLAIIATPFRTLNDLWRNMHTWQTWRNDTTWIGVISPQLHDPQLNQDLEAMLGLYPNIPAQEALERALHRLTWEFQPLIPLYEELWNAFFRVAALQGPVGLRGINGIDAWTFAIETNQSAVRIGTCERGSEGFLPYESIWSSVIYPPQAVLNGLLVLNYTMTPEAGSEQSLEAYLPDLARSLPIPVAGTSKRDGITYTAEDRRIWEISIRNGITWHPGYGYPAMPFTLEDVLFTYHSLWTHHREQGYLQWLFGADSAKGIEVVNSTTLRLYLSDPGDPAPEDGMRFTNMFYSFLSRPILPQHILNPMFDSTGLGEGNGGAGRTADGAPIRPIEEWSKSDFHLGYRTGDYHGAAVIGTGPYLWVGANGTLAYSPNATQVTLSRNNVYFKDNRSLRLPTDSSTALRPPVASFIECQNNVSALEGLLNGSIDVLWDWGSHQGGVYSLNKVACQALIDDPLYNATKVAGLIMCVFVNTAHPRLTRPVRLAIAHAINHDQLAQELLQAEDVGMLDAVANELPLSVLHPAYPKNLPTPSYDLATAWDYMEEAGYDMSPYRLKDSSPVETSSGLILGLIGPLCGILVLGLMYWSKRCRR